MEWRQLKPGEVMTPEQVTDYIRAQRQIPSDAMSVADRALWDGIRQGLLAMVDAIERRIGTSPRTAEIRKERR